MSDHRGVLDTTWNRRRRPHGARPPPRQPAIDLIGITTVYGDTKLRPKSPPVFSRRRQSEHSVHAGARTTLSGREGLVGRARRRPSRRPRKGTLRLGRSRPIPRQHRRLTRRDRSDRDGPLTNIAHAIAEDPRFAESVRHLWIMGGAFGSDETEHNFRSDAVAARAVFAAGIPTTVTGLEVTRQIHIGAPELQRIAGSGNSAASCSRRSNNGGSSGTPNGTFPTTP